MSMSGISIVTPALNQSRFLERTILSIMNQERDVPVEHIVVDGGSTDGTLEILKKYSGKVRWVSGPDEGMSDALNKGFAMAGGEIIGWLNADDLYLPGALQHVALWFRDHPDCLWLYGNCRMIDENDREIRKWITAYKNRGTRNFSFNRLLTENFISQPAVFMRRSVLLHAGPVDTGLPTAMDYDLWLRLAKIGRPGHLNEDLACFRVHGQSISARNFRKQFAEQYRIHRRYDRNRLRLLKHRIKNALIVFAYTVLNCFTRR